MNQDQIINARLQAFREASILANRYTSTHTSSYNINGIGQNLPVVVGIESIIRDAEVIYNFLIKTNGN